MARNLRLYPFVVALSGCNSLLDIKDAHVDPRLDRATTDAAVVSGNSPSDTATASDDPAEDSGASTSHTEYGYDDDQDESDAGPSDRDDVTTTSAQSPGGLGSDDQSLDASTGSDNDGQDDEQDEDEDSDDDATSALDAAAEDDDHGHGHSDTDAEDSGIDQDEDEDEDEQDEDEDPDDDAMGDAGSEPSLCEKYCDDITELCTGDAEQYRDRAQCLRVCTLLPQGTLGSEDNENSAACRLRYAAKARYAAGTELAAYCRQAGPGGDGRCGSNCEGFCSLMMGVCTEAEAEIYHYEAYDDCVDVCGGLPLNPEGYSTANPDISDGNDVQCRLFHVTSAAMLDAEEHCEHAMGLTLCEGTAAEN